MGAQQLRLDDGITVTAEFVRSVVSQELAAIRTDIGDQAFAASKFSEAGRLFEAVALDDDYAEFLTLPAYEFIA